MTGLTLAIAMSYPKAFLAIAERITSMALNLEAGLFIVIMLINARKLKIAEEHRVPLVLPAWIYSFRFIVIAYFAFAVFYDFFAWICGILGFSFASYL